MRDAERKAREFIDRIETIVSAKDNLIYDIESEVRSPNVISPSTVGDKDAIVSVELFNVGNADDAFDVDTWISLGQIADGIDKWSAGDPGSDTALIEFHARFKS